MLGDEYAHRFFWIQACQLLSGRRNVIKVSLEKPDIRAFDDVAAHYREPELDAHGRPITADYFQLKFHLTRTGVIRGSDLINPAFVNAETVSLLERVHAVTGDSDRPLRLNLVTPWAIDNKDPLARLVGNRDGALELETLFKARRSSALGAMREAWRERLGGVDDGALRRALRHLRFQSSRAMDRLDEALTHELVHAGLAPVNTGSAVNQYVAISRRLILDDQREHDAQSLEAIIRRENLRLRLPTLADSRRAIGVKSFDAFAVELADKAETLDLLPYFHGRGTAKDITWDRDIAPTLRRFLREKIGGAGPYDLYFDAHLSLAYLAGVELGKAAIEIAPARRDRVWRATRPPGHCPWPAKIVELGDGPELAIAIEITRPVAFDVESYLRANVADVGRLLVFTAPGGASDSSINDADHALDLARGVTLTLQSGRKTIERGRWLHIFISAPTPFAFFLGREGRAYGPTKTYEHDFGGAAPAAYSPALEIRPGE
jgi:SMODS-associated and fused to various effectors sensor domain